ncbi:MAG: cytochrome c, partial [Myxococcales bacterium]|nr:cytochrome c [Myxococcales bacterium]
MRSRLFMLALPLSLASCEWGGAKFDTPLKLGGQEVQPHTLKKGYEAYQQYCRPCHGDNGDGRGYSSKGLRPPPRDFTQALFKFGGVPAPGLPPDSEMKRIVKSGLHGTAMLPWDITDEELTNTLQYIKTFSPRWQAEVPGEVVKGVDPNYTGDKKVQAIELGKKLFHAKAQCSAACHANAVGHAELFELTKAATGNELTEFAADMYNSKLKDSEYCLEWKPGWKKLEDRECALPVKIMPPDFTIDDVR